MYRNSDSCAAVISTVSVLPWSNSSTVSDAVDDVHVVPDASSQRVRAAAARQPIVAVIAGDLVVAVIAGAGDVIVTASSSRDSRTRLPRCS